MKMYFSIFIAACAGIIKQDLEEIRTICLNMVISYRFGLNFFPFLEESIEI